MGYLNSTVARVKPSETLAIKALASQLMAAGKSVVDLSAGEPDIDTPQHIKDAAAKAMAEGKTKYTAVSGIDPLKEAIIEKFARDSNLHFSKSGVIVCNGGKQAIHNVMEVVLEPGDEVVMVSPYWVSYPAIVQLAGGKPVVVNTLAKEGYKLKPQALAAAITPRTKVVIMNSPSNPTGVAYTAEELAAFGEVIAPSRALVLSDEVYEKIIYGNFKFTSFAAACPALAERTVTVNACSKTYSMTGWRIGYAAGSPEIIEAVGRYQSQTTSNVCSIAQYAAVAALKGSLDFLEPLKATYARRLAMGMDAISSTRGLTITCRPEGAFFLFIRFDGLLDAMNSRSIKGSAGLSSWLLNEVGVAVVPGEAFGDDLALRISVSSSDANLAEGLKRLTQGVATLLG